MSAQLAGDSDKVHAGKEKDEDQKMQADLCTSIYVNGKEKTAANISGYKPFARSVTDSSRQGLQEALKQYLKECYFDLTIKFSLNGKRYTLHKNDKKNSLEPFVNSNALAKGEEITAGNHQRSPSVSDSPKESPDMLNRKLSESPLSKPKMESPKVPGSGTPPQRRVSGLDLSGINKAGPAFSATEPLSAAAETTPPHDSTPPGEKTPPVVPSSTRRSMSGEFVMSPKALEMPFASPKMGSRPSLGAKPPLASPPPIASPLAVVAVGEKPKPRPPAGPAPKRPGSASPKLPERPVSQNLMMSVPGQQAAHTGSESNVNDSVKAAGGSSGMTRKFVAPSPKRP